MREEWPSLRKHLFLTGAKQVGKSTLLRKLIQAQNIRYSGFETRLFMANGERRGFTLHGHVDMPPFENDCICCARIGEKRSVPILPVFDENGTAILKNSLNVDVPFILMDELGKLERDATAFVAQVFACLDSDKHVIGVLQRCDSEHIQAISSREDVTVITVTPENRDDLFDWLVTHFC